MRRATALAVFAALLCALAPASAVAEEIPPYEGSMSFPAIQDPAGPEEFPWEVQLYEGQELRQIDDRRAAVYYTESEHLAFGIGPGAAHDVVGTDVPTTLTVTQPNVITLTVHHRAGNPARGGAPFDYPVNAGAGWEGGFVTYRVLMPPAETSAPLPPPVSVIAPACLVPNLGGKSLKASRRALRGSNCSLGPVRGERAKGAKVAKQYRQPGSSLPAGAVVGVKLG
ncbi:MAG TPA: hypothetical protein VD761_08900 [Solirubrobacterales bacterium]|nr:hypothetical protein [Solirubrobacterales bacterium]